MKKNLFVGISVLLLILALQGVSAQTTGEKVVGPVTILSPAQPVIYPDTNFKVSFSAAQANPTQVHVVTVGRNAAAPWLATTAVNINLVSGTQSTSTLQLDWVYFPPGETVVRYIPVSVVPNNDYQLRITEPNAIAVTATKSGSLNQRKLAIIREGDAFATVSIQQIAPVTGSVIQNQYTSDLYLDYGGTIEIRAPRPTPSPCACPQTVFQGISGDVNVPGSSDAGVSTATLTMDGDKQITIRYIISGSSGTATPPVSPTPTPTLTSTPVLLKGDANEDRKVTIVDALVVAQYCAGFAVSIDYANADANCDSTITITDALLIARYTVGLLPGLCQ